MRLMTWNCLGMTDAIKQAKLRAYLTAQNIDMAFLQEGGSAFDEAESEANTLSSTYMVPGANETERLIEYAFGSNASGVSMVHSMAGVSRAAYYNIVTEATTMATFAKAAPNEPDFINEQRLTDWIKEPASSSLLRRDAGGKLFEVQNSRRGGLKNSGSPRVKDALSKHILKPVQSRVNMMGHRRPKFVTIGGLKIYYWHAPLGGGTDLNTLGFQDIAPYAGSGSGGPLAVTANVVFSRFLKDKSSAFPADTILLGDLNVSNEDGAIQAIYKTDNVISSHDGLCHVVAGDNLALTSIINTLDQGALGISDHDPIVFDVV